MKKGVLVLVAITALFCFGYSVVADDTVIKLNVLVNDVGARQALARAFFFAIKEPVFNKDWKKSNTTFDVQKAKSISDAYIVTSIKKYIKYHNSEVLLMYSSDFDLFSVVYKLQDGKFSAGIIDGKTVSEKIYGVMDTKNPFENIYVRRPAIVKKLFEDFSDAKFHKDAFEFYQVNKDVSDSIKADILSFSAMIGINNRCRDSIEKSINAAEFKYSDGRDSKVVGLLYTTTLLPFRDAANGPIKGVAMFHDVGTNRYGGYLIYDPRPNADCHIINMVTTVF